MVIPPTEMQDFPYHLLERLMIGHDKVQRLQVVGVAQ